MPDPLRSSYDQFVCHEYSSPDGYPYWVDETGNSEWKQEIFAKIERMAKTQIWAVTRDETLSMVKLITGRAYYWHDYGVVKFDGSSVEWFFPYNNQSALQGVLYRGALGF